MSLLRSILTCGLLAFAAISWADEPEWTLRLDALEAIPKDDTEQFQSTADALAADLSHHDDMVAAHALDRLGRLCFDRLGPASSSDHFQRARAICLRELGPGDHLTLDLSTRVAQNHVYAGDLETAEALLVEAHAAAQQAYDSDAEIFINLLDVMGMVADSRSDYQVARERFQRALELSLKHHGPDSRSTGVRYYRRSRIDYIQGDNAAAYEGYTRCIDAWRAALGPADALVGVGLQERAAVLANEERYDEAVADLEASRQIMEAALPVGHTNLGGLYHRYGYTESLRGQYDAARHWLEQALAIREASNMPQNTASTLAALGEVLQKQGHPELAEPVFRREADIFAETFGTEHHFYAGALQSIALNHIELGRIDQALDVALEAEQLQHQQLRREARSMAERAGLLYADRQRGKASLNVALTLVSHGLSPDQLRRIWDAQIEARSVILDELAYRRRELGASDEAQDPVTAELPQPITLTDVEARLPDEAVLISFSRYKNQGQDVFGYVALVRTPDGNVHGSSLGPALEIDSLVSRWRTEARGDRLGTNRAEAERRYLDIAHELRRKVWDPLAKWVDGHPLVFVVPDGPLALVNFSALPREDGSYLVESGPTLHVLDAERDLLEDRVATTTRGLLAMGNPAYDAKRDEMVLASTSAANTFRGSRSSCEGFHDMSFTALPGSAAEVQAIATHWDDEPTEILTGPGANEATFKALAPKFRVVHLATHGFFLQWDCTTRDRDSTRRSVGGMAPTAQSPIVSPEDNLLSISGLALAGANARHEAPTGTEDGVVTAEEVSALDLSGVEWAVLSACDTGVGEVHNAEGVLGLRRAFRAAGAHTLILSLWPVDDLATRDWMEALYHARFARQLSTAEAIREAGRSRLAAARDAGTTTHPFSWASFVATGDWR